MPWRSAEIYQKLSRRSRSRQPYARDNIKFFSSVLTHYVSDAHVPFHAVLNYDGQLTGQWGIHSRFETELFERYRASCSVVPKPVASDRQRARLHLRDADRELPASAAVLDADKAAVAGREVYDDGYFTMFFGKVQPILERRLARLDHRRRRR